MQLLLGDFAVSLPWTGCPSALSPLRPAWSRLSLADLIGSQHEGRSRLLRLAGSKIGAVAGMRDLDTPRPGAPDHDTAWQALAPGPTVKLEQILS